MNPIAARILAQHSVQVRYVAGRLQCLDVVIGPDGADCSAWVDASQWGPKQVLDWLGY